MIDRTVETVTTEGHINISGDGRTRKFEVKFDHPYPVTQVILKPESIDAKAHTYNVVIEANRFEIYFETAPPEGDRNLSFSYRIS